MQGMIVDEVTGADIAVTYDPTDASGIVCEHNAHAVMLAALEMVLDCDGDLNAMDFDMIRAAVRKGREYT